MSDDVVSDLRQETRAIFYHGYDNYMRYAFPEDELRPLSCSPLVRDRANPAHIEVNDVLGNYSLTLIDSLSTLAILASSPPPGQKHNKALQDFQDGVVLIVENYGDGTNTSSGVGKRSRGFELDSKVQIFETVIRGLGGLLSAHQFAVGDLPIRGYDAGVQDHEGTRGIRWNKGFVYDGQLLRLAHDLGRRLLPAFSTPTGIPYPRVNLKHGVPFYLNSPLNNAAEFGQCEKGAPESPEITETCSAGAGSLVLELTTLSRLTGDWRFEIAGKRAFWAVWERRSSSGLIGSGIDAETGRWMSPYTGVGAGIDSFFEYAFKSYIFLSGVDFEPNGTVDSSAAFLHTWQDAHQSIKRHVYRGAAFQHPHYAQVDLYTGALRAYWIDSLSAYYPGLLALAGELDEAIETHLLYTALWTRFSAIPERWSTSSGNIEAGLRWWGGRPEFIESTWYLYRATQDPFYLHVAEMTLRDIKRRCWTRCGWAGLQDVRTGELSDRMESFFLGETAKYLFLLFDKTHPLNTWDAPFVFTTEGHPLIIPKEQRRMSKFRAKAAMTEDVEMALAEETCPLPPPVQPFSLSAAAARPDLFHAASLARLHLMPSIETVDSPLVEFSSDHPSISVSDLHSPSNYSYYPWTLPMELVPWNATSSRMATRSTFDLAFPNMLNTALTVQPLQKVVNGYLVRSLSGVRLGMVREGGVHGTSFDMPEAFRIYTVSNFLLGRDEQVFVERDAVSSFDPADAHFTKLRDSVNLDVIIDIKTPQQRDPEPSAEAEVDGPNDNLTDSILFDESGLLSELDIDLENADVDGPSLLSSLLTNIQNLLASSTSRPQSTTKARAPDTTRSALIAAMPTGPGAAPLPDVPDIDYVYRKDRLPPWRTIYLADNLCTTKLSRSVPRTHQVLVIRRGGCSFSQKLQNIPAYAPSPSSLQLVIVVSFPEHEERRQGADDDDSLIQPLLDVQQLTPSGIVRPHPIPMIMVGGGEETMTRFGRAQGVGVRRRFHYASQGLRIANLVVL
ncbi:hypothetical protein EJ05DRAFT_478511 [Pseudovirgaria hyperparasitica]|uniref:alpha-1,2-Mannosidase n=1 Tax=Pseudovirgaria hyperparasitica TaxID=470096 RepID=A0A6A6VXY6_9PEZI|nr:uncharacterized protein EJ05DRAFT_478511 [Pseudovirgaria hyperparasitica]KAF2755518.1 hypothetical protein EJ05DRAFT_478511 [Pseudovirgaria hyperparasitica]